MKKLTAILLTAVMLLAGCGVGAKDLSRQVSKDIPDLYLYVDSADVTDGNVRFKQIKDKFAEVELDDVHYYATSIKNLCAKRLSGQDSRFVLWLYQRQPPA